MKFPTPRRVEAVPSRSVSRRRCRLRPVVAPVGLEGIFLLVGVTSELPTGRFGRLFDRFGVLAVPLSNTLLFTRGMLTVPAGVAGMSTRRFVALSALGTLSFEILLAAAAMGVLELF